MGERLGNQPQSDLFHGLPGPEFRFEQKPAHAYITSGSHSVSAPLVARPHNAFVTASIGVMSVPAFLTSQAVPSPTGRVPAPFSAVAISDWPMCTTLRPSGFSLVAAS